VLGLGALATGSGATFTSAAFSGSIGSTGPGMGVVSASNVIVAPGDTAYDDDTSNLSPGDLPAASVTDDGDSVAIDIVTRIDASGESFPGLFSIENDSTDAIEVDIDFSTVNTLNESLTKDEIEGAYTFTIDGTDISNTNGSDGTAVVIGSGNTKNVDLGIDFQSPNDIVSTLRQNVNRPSGSPFSGNVGSVTRLVEEITINTNSAN
jgi:hypothetical protein